MIINRAVFITIALICWLPISAQEGFTDFEKDYFSKNASNKQKEFIDKIILPEHVFVPTVKSQAYTKYEKFGWDSCLKKCFAAFFTEAKSYGYHRQVALVYGLLNLGNYDILNYRNALKNNFNDTTWVEQTYQSILPILKEGWSLLDKNTKLIYISIIKHIDTYLNVFNYNQELNYYNDLVQTSNSDDFIQKGVSNYSRIDYRKAEAFIFRRVFDSDQKKGNWSIRWMKKMVRKIKRNFVIA